MNRKGFAPLIIIGIAAAVVIASLSVWYFVAHKNPVSPSGIACTADAKECPDGSYVGRTGPDCEFATCPMAAVSSTLSAVSSTMDTSEWQTYTNQQYGFSIDYPSDWYASSASDPGVLFVMGINQKDPEGYGVAISVYDNQNNLTIDQWINTDQPGGADVIENQTTTIASAYNGGYVTRNLSLWGGDHTEGVIVILKGGYIFELTFDQSDPNDSDFARDSLIYSKMISTFQFIQSTSTVIQ